MKGIEVKRKNKVANKFDLIKLTVKFICMSMNFSLSETELFALTYFVINGFNKVTRDELIDNKLFKTKNAVANSISRFRKYGIINKTIYGEELLKDFSSIDPGIDAVKFECFIISDGRK